MKTLGDFLQTESSTLLEDISMLFHRAEAVELDIESTRIKDFWIELTDELLKRESLRCYK